jgi:hypothetical protein
MRALQTSLRKAAEGRLELGVDTSTRDEEYSAMRRSAWNSSVQVIPRFGNLGSPAVELRGDTRSLQREVDELLVEMQKGGERMEPDGQRGNARRKDV